MERLMPKPPFRTLGLTELNALVVEKDFGHSGMKCYPESYPENKKAGDGVSGFQCMSLICLVGETGFEPATPCTPCRCATRLRYTPKSRIIAVWVG